MRSSGIGSKRAARDGHAVSPVIAAGFALACGGCHDWDQFTRPYVAPDGSATRDASAGAVRGSEQGNFACPRPHALVPVSDARGPRIERVPLAGGSCAPLRVWGFNDDEPVRAVAVQGSRVVAVGDLGACVLEVSDAEIRGNFAPFPGRGEVRDALVFDDGRPRFAAAVAIGTSSAINHLFVEDNNGELTRDITTTTSPRIPAAFGSATMRSISSEPNAPYRLYAVLEQADYLVSALPNGTERRAVLSNSAPDLYEAVSAGAPNAMGQPVVAMVPRGTNIDRFDAHARNIRFSMIACSPCRSLRHVVPANSEELTYAVLCTNESDSYGLYLRGSSACGEAIATWSPPAFVGRMAVR